MRMKIRILYKGRMLITNYRKDVIFQGQHLILMNYFGEPCLYITSPEQISIQKMQFVGGYPNEYCIYIKDLTDE